MTTEYTQESTQRTKSSHADGKRSTLSDKKPTRQFLNKEYNPEKIYVDRGGNTISKPEDIMKKLLKKNQILQKKSYIEMTGRKSNKKWINKVTLEIIDEEQTAKERKRDGEPIILLNSWNQRMRRKANDLKRKEAGNHPAKKQKQQPQTQSVPQLTTPIPKPLTIPEESPLAYYASLSAKIPFGGLEYDGSQPLKPLPVASKAYGTGLLFPPRISEISDRPMQYNYAPNSPLPELPVTEEDKPAPILGGKISLGAPTSPLTSRTSSSLFTTPRKPIASAASSYVAPEIPTDNSTNIKINKTNSF